MQGAKKRSVAAKAQRNGPTMLPKLTILQRRQGFQVGRQLCLEAAQLCHVLLLLLTATPHAEKGAGKRYSAEERRKAEQMKGERDVTELAGGLGKDIGWKA
jgi:hypothetical protein